MTPERWRHVSAVYHAAHARPAAEWSAYLREACAGDAALQAEIEGLLADETRARVLLSTPVLAVVVGAPVVSGANSLVGRRIGVYQVLGLIGKGGMGEVYRAHDTQLRREVALKVLPPAFTNDPDRLARFEREARILAALNHPHIATIYGLERAEGIHALVLELIEGPTLAERIEPWAVSGGRVGDRAADRRGARCRARERNRPPRSEAGQHHVTPNGPVKVLDFGLAKTWRSAAEASRRRHNPGTPRAGRSARWRT